MADSGIRIAIDEFTRFTGYDLSNYLVRVDTFFTKNQPKIFNWYKGITDTPDADSFKSLFLILNESSKVLLLFDNNKGSFDNKFYFFELLENLELIDNKLLTTLNLSRLLRSVRTINSYKSKIESDYVMKKYDTLESIQNQNVSPNDFDNKWWDLALRNDLSEEEYDIEGGDEIKIPLDLQSNIFLTSVVDNMIGDRMYGKDIQRKLKFENDDLKTLSYKETAEQSVEIFLETKIGTVPENPTLGYEEDLVVGTTKASISLPVLKRQLNSIFNTDDSFSSFSIKKIEIKQDALYVEFEVNTVRGELINKTLKV